jgi:hypothetical protein
MSSGCDHCGCETDGHHFDHFTPPDSRDSPFMTGST